MTSKARRPGKWKRVLLGIVLLLLAAYAVWYLYYTRPITLEESERLDRLDDCQQIIIDILHIIDKETEYGTPYHTRIREYQVLTAEDESFEMVMDYVRENTFHRAVSARGHKPYAKEGYFWVSIVFYDHTDPVEVNQGVWLARLELKSHCADPECVICLTGLPGDPVHNSSSGLYGPLVNILETITAEKGGWLNSKE